MDIKAIPARARVRPKRAGYCFGPVLASSSGNAPASGELGPDPPSPGGGIDGATELPGAAVVEVLAGNVVLDDGDTDVVGLLVVDVTGAPVVVVVVVEVDVSGGPSVVVGATVVEVDVDVDDGGSRGSQLPSTMVLGQFWPGKPSKGGITSSACCVCPPTAFSGTSMRTNGFVTLLVR